jgi:hypothetical protein
MHDELENEELEEEHVHVYSSGPFRFDCTFCKGTGVHPATMKF